MQSQINQSETSLQENAPLSNWPEPLSFTEIELDESPYPVDALPAILKNTIIEYQKYGQQPIAQIACSALAKVSLAC